MSHGWTWKIPLLNRFGSGYVYSSKFVSQDQATDEFLSLWGLNPNDVKLNQIKFRTGRNRRAWVKNCVSIGLSSCFLEPLESTGIYFIYAAIYQLVKHFPDRGFNQQVIDQFNEEIIWMYDDCRDFVQAHYINSLRRDTPFWEANKHDLKMSDSMEKKLNLYKAGLTPAAPLSNVTAYYDNFETEFRNFWPNSSYYCVFSGMGLMPEMPLAKLRYSPSSLAKAQTLFDDLRKQSETLLETLPSCHEYLKILHRKDGSPPRLLSP
jgi:tryptophan halogenase